MIGSCWTAPQESWKIHKGMQTAQNKGAVVSGFRTSLQDRRGVSGFCIHHDRMQKLGPMHLPKTCWTQCVYSAVPLTRYENSDWSLSISGSLPEASYRKCRHVIFSACFSPSPPHAGAPNERIPTALSPACTPAEVQPLCQATCRLQIREGRLSLVSGRPDIWREEEGPFDVGGRMEPCLFLWSRCQCKAASLSPSLCVCVSLCPPLTMPACQSLSSVSFVIHLSPSRPLLFLTLITFVVFQFFMASC